MVLRYYCMDWYPIPVKEEELLFNGTEVECQKYLLKNWIVDYLETPKELLSKAIHDIHHIQYLDINVKYKGGAHIPVHKLVDMEIYDKLMGHKDWKDIDASQYIFNKELISIT